MFAAAVGAAGTSYILAIFFLAYVRGVGVRKLARVAQAFCTVWGAWWFIDTVRSALCAFPDGDLKLLTTEDLDLIVTLIFGPGLWGMTATLVLFEWSCCQFRWDDPSDI